MTDRFEGSRRYLARARGSLATGVSTAIRAGQLPMPLCFRPPYDMPGICPPARLTCTHPASSRSAAPSAVLTSRVKTKAASP